MGMVAMTSDDKAGMKREETMTRVQERMDAIKKTASDSKLDLKVWAGYLEKGAQTDFLKADLALRQVNLQIEKAVKNNFTLTPEMAEIQKKASLEAVYYKEVLSGIMKLKKAKTEASIDMPDKPDKDVKAEIQKFADIWQLRIDVMKDGIEKEKEIERKRYTEALAATVHNADAIALETEKFNQNIAVIDKKYADIKAAQLAGAASIEADDKISFNDWMLAQDQKQIDEEEALAQESEDAKMDRLKREWEAEKELKQKELELTKQSMQTVMDIYMSSQDKKLMILDDAASTDEEAKKKELAVAGLTEAEKEKIETKYAKREAERAKEKKKIAHDEAVANKAFAVANILLNTAVAIAKDLAGNKLMIPFDIAMGALQLAAAMAVPIPKYAKGRKGGKAEIADVGEQGVEAIRMLGGDYSLPDKLQECLFLRVQILFRMINYLTCRKWDPLLRMFKILLN
jgi:hypothetical protein